MSDQQPAWMQERPWRNANPGDLRTLPLPQQWVGQTAVDDGPGGPFAVFATRVDGWRALARNMIAYQDIHGLHTIRSMIGRFAPALENDTGGYVSLVARQLDVGPDDTIDAHEWDTMLALVKAIALAEGSARIQWPQAEIASGLVLAGLQQPSGNTTGFSA